MRFIVDSDTPQCRAASAIVPPKNCDTRCWVNSSGTTLHRRMRNILRKIHKYFFI